MKISMYAMSHDVFKKALTQLLHVMEKGVANAKARNFDTGVLVAARLAPDMLPFVKQIQLTSDFAKNSMARLAGVDPPKFEDNETTMDELFARADILTVNCPLTEDTHHIVNAKRLGLMKKTAYLINTARGPIVDQKALTEVLTNHRIAGAGLDVFEIEPTDPNDPLLKLDNIIVAPHALCWTDQCFAGNGAADVRAVLEVQKGRIPRGVVNREVLERARFKSKLETYGKHFKS